MDAPEDELYDLPAGEFVAARDELAKQLRSDGETDDAARIKKLKRPSVAAAAVNHAVRGHTDARDELLAAGKALRSAQEKLSGRDGRAKLREAAERERTAVRALAETAEASVDQPSAALSEKVRQTLHAAALDEEAREQIAVGRVTREHEAVAGFGFGNLAEEEAPAEAREPTKAAKKKGGRAATKKRDDEEKREREEQREAERQRELEEAEDALAQAREAANEAEREHADAEATLDEAREALDEATTAERETRKAKRERAREATRRERELEKLR